MPLLQTSDYRSPLIFANPHLQTIYPTLVRRPVNRPYRRERIDTPDNDFIDVDWLDNIGEKVALISHGLEGCSSSSYVKGMCKALHAQGWSIAAWNMRGCSGSLNRQLRYYHSGASDDLDLVVASILSSNRFSSMALVGFSLGGNITLKYLGEKGAQLPNQLKRAVAFSVPCDLAGCARKLALRQNRLYMQHFLRTLRIKMLHKQRAYPDRIDLKGIEKIRTFEEFDNRYTGPLHGFKDAEEYWRLCSSLHFIDKIQIPTLLVNAADDPFLSHGCYPIESADKSPFLYLEMPQQGGHAGFIELNRERLYWSERRCCNFLNNEEINLATSHHRK